MTDGIILLALGSQFYGDMAFNLLLSIKNVSPNIPVKLWWSGNAICNIPTDRLARFDQHEMLPDYIINHEGKTKYFRAKTFLYDLSPFDNTLYLDVDGLWLHKPVEEIFTMLKDVDFTIANRGGEEIKDHTKWLWGHPKEFKEKYGSWLPNYHSEFVWFKKSERAQKYFDVVKEVYDNPPIASKPFAGGLADEYAYVIASVVTGIQPHKVPFIPTYWQFVDRKRGTGMKYITENHYYYSMGGNVHSSRMKMDYDRIAMSNAAMAKIYGGVYQLRNKRSFDTTRMFL